MLCATRAGWHHSRTPDRRPTLTFFEQQQAAKRRARIYILQFVLLLVPCVIGTYIATLLAISIIANSIVIGLLSDFAAFDPLTTSLKQHFGVFLLISTLIYTPLLLWTLVSIRGRQLRRTEAFVAREIGARRVERRTPEADARRLYNVVEEMAIAAGIAPPEVYIWEAEGIINSLTLGQSESDAALFVSRGALETLSRAEMQALVGHGMSQILNGDAALNIRLATYMHAFRFAPRVTMFFLAFPAGQKSFVDRVQYCIVWIFFFLWIGLLMAVVTCPQYLSARLLQFGISRQRQKLADASALQFTRDRDALLAVFAKAIAWGTTPPKQSRLLEDLSHSCFAAPFAQKGFWRTHLPLKTRLLALNPSFSMARIADYQREATSRLEAEKKRILQQQMQQRQQKRPADLTQLSRRFAAFVPALTAPLEVAPTHALTALEPVDDARTELIALLLEVRPDGRRLQLAAVHARFGDQGLIALARVVRDAKASDHAQRSIELDTLLPRLRELPPAELKRMLETILALERADHSVSVFEYALSRRAAVFIGDLLKPREPHGKRVLADFPQALQVLFSVMARHSAARKAPMAYEAGVLIAGAPASGRYQELSEWIQPLDDALGQLEYLQPLAKELLLKALSRIARYDGEETPGERELIRAIASGLHCPIERGSHAAVD